MKYFFSKLLANRANFVETMTDSERAIMAEHGTYYAELAEKGWAVAYGPVMSEQGSFGAGFWALPDDVSPAQVADNDPAIRANAGFRYEISPMPILVTSKFTNAEHH